MAKKAGVNKKLMKETAKKVNTYLNDMTNHLAKLSEDVIKMNNTAWYGGKSANTWYKNISDNHTNAVKVMNAMKQLNTKMTAQATKYDQIF